LVTVVDSVTEPTEVQALPGMFAPGSVLLDRYRVDGMLGVGGYGLVLRAWSLIADEPVAIKVLRADLELERESVQRFVREAHAFKKLASLHAAKMIEVGTLDDGAPYIVMELLEGQDLGKQLAQNGPFPMAIAIDYVLQVCDVLAETHAHGIVHRDIKPTNLFAVTRPDGGALIKVLDFGISKAPVLAGEQLTQTASILGTPAYMSPEQMRSARRVDARSDIWSLGVVLYELVECRLPFPASSYADLAVRV